MHDYRITEQGTGIHYSAPSNRDCELEAKNERLRAYVSRLLDDRARLAARVRELEAIR